VSAQRATVRYDRQRLAAINARIRDRTRDQAELVAVAGA
jgi:hypothetical protein